MSRAAYNKGIIDAVEAILRKLDSKREIELKSTNGSVDVIRVLSQIIEDIESSKVTLD